MGNEKIPFGGAVALLACATFLLAAVPGAAQSSPGVPQNVELTAGAEKLTLTWQAPASWGSLSASHFEIDWRIGTSGDWNILHSQGSGLIEPRHTATSYTFTGNYRSAVVGGHNQYHTVTSGTTYQFRIRAVSSGTSGNERVERVSQWVVTTSGTPQSGPTMTLGVSPNSAAESAAATSITVTASLAGSQRAVATEVTVSRTGGTATPGTDYAAISAFTVTIAAGASSGTATLSFDPTEDTIDEDNETVILTGTASGLTAGTATLTITDNDDAPTAVSLAVSPASALESASATSITVTASLVGSQRAVATEVTVSQTGGTATSGTDYAAISAFTVTIAAGASSGTATLSFDPTEDSIDEDNETVILTGTASGLTAGTATLTITDNDAAPTAVTLGVSPNSAAESAAATNITVAASLVGSQRAVATEVTVSRTGGTATSGTDYAAISAFTVTIAAGASSGTATLSFDPTEDNVDEDNETVILTGTASGLTAGTATLTITDNDDAPTAVSLAVSPASALESAAATNITVTASLVGSARTAATEVTVSRTGGTATSGTDYAAISAFTVTIAAGASSGTATLSFDPTEDQLDEDNETVVLTGAAPSSLGLTAGTATLTITDNDGAPTALTLGVSPASALESASATNITVTASLVGSARATATEVTVSRTGGTASSGTDYAAISAFTVTIAAGASSGTATLSFDPTEDSIDDDNETVILTGTATGLTAGTATLTITDNDAAPTAVTLAVSPASVLESAAATSITVTASLVGSQRAVATAVTVSRTGGTAASGTDYAVISAFTVTIAAGASSGTATLSFDPTEDNVDEQNETVILTGTAAGLTAGTATLTITDSDTTGPGAPTFSPLSGATVTDAATNITLTFAEAIKKDSSNTDFAGHSELAAILTLKRTNSSGTTIGYAATINSAKTIITINPTSNLPEGAIYVAISNAYYDASGNQGAAASATFTVDTPSSDATLSALTATTSSDGTTFSDPLNIGTFAATTTIYTATVAYAVTHVKLTPTVAESSATVAVGKQGRTLAAVTSRQASGAIALGVGPNAITVRVTAQDSTTEDYTVTITRQAQSDLTARFSSVPTTHDGSAAFKARIQFSKAVTITAETTFKDHSVEVLGGTVSDADRLGGDSWEITVAPAGGGAVVVALPPTASCADPGALCTSDGRRLSARVEALVRGPDTAVVTIAPVSASITEGEDAVFRLRRTGGTGPALTVGLSVTGAGDFIAGSPPQTAAFLAGEATVSLDIPTEDDALGEPGALLTVELSEDTASPPDYVLGSPSRAILQVLDNEGGPDPPPLPGTSTAPPERRKPLPLQLALWTDKPAYRAGETVRLYYTVHPHDDGGQYRVFAWLEPAEGEGRRYLAPLSADAALHPEAVDIRGLPEHASQARSLPRADKALAWDGEGLAPGRWRFVLELRPGTPLEQYEDPPEPLRTRRAWASFTVTERSLLLNRRRGHARGSRGADLLAARRPARARLLGRPAHSRQGPGDAPAGRGPGRAARRAAGVRGHGRRGLQRRAALCARRVRRGQRRPGGPRSGHRPVRGGQRHGPRPPPGPRQPRRWLRFPRRHRRLRPLRRQRLHRGGLGLGARLARRGLAPVRPARQHGPRRSRWQQ